MDTPLLEAECTKKLFFKYTPTWVMRDELILKNTKSPSRKSLMFFIICVLDSNCIPAVRNKVNTTDLNGPSAQPKWVDGVYNGRIILKFN